MPCRARQAFHPQKLYDYITKQFILQEPEMFQPEDAQPEMCAASQVIVAHETLCESKLREVPSHCLEFSVPCCQMVLTSSGLCRSPRRQVPCQVQLSGWSKHVPPAVPSMARYPHHKKHHALPPHLCCILVPTVACIPGSGIAVSMNDSTLHTYLGLNFVP